MRRPGEVRNLLRRLLWELGEPTVPASQVVTSDAANAAKGGGEARLSARSSPNAVRAKASKVPAGPGS